MCPVFWGTRSGRNWRTLGSGLLLSTVVAAVSSSDLFASKNTSTDFVLLRPIVVSSSNGFSMKTSTSSAYLGCRLNFFFFDFCRCPQLYASLCATFKCKSKNYEIKFPKMIFWIDHNFDSFYLIVDLIHYFNRKRVFSERAGLGQRISEFATGLLTHFSVVWNFR